MDYDKKLSTYFLQDPWHFNRDNCKKYTLKKKRLINIKKYIDNRYVDSLSFKETIYRMYYNIENRPTCKTCGGDVKFIGKKPIIFRQYCCNRCSGISPETINKKQLSDKAKHNGHLGWNKNTPEKNNKRLTTIYNKYGSMSYFKDKVKETCISKYGVETPMLLKDVQLKRNNSLQQNNSFNKSKQEELAYDILIEYFGQENIIRQYSDNIYKWNCDFYIKSLKLYIECNFSHFHHYRPFNINNEEDIDELNLLYQKSKILNRKNQYDKIIYTWTDLDVRKLKCFIDNNLNYKIFYSLNELKEWIEKRRDS